MSLASRMFAAQAEGKALGPHPAFMDPGTPVSVVNAYKPQTTDGRPRLTQREAMRHLDAYGGDQAIDWVMDAVRFTADTVASAEYHFEKPRPASGRKVPGEQVDPPPRLADLLDQPNPYMDYVEMMELLVIDLLLVGNAYWFKWRTSDAGQPLALYRLSPACVKVVAQPWGIGGYEYNVPGMEKLEIAPEEVIHFKLANPHSPYYGLGLVQGAGRAADMELALADSQASYFENHAMPSLAVQSDRRVPRDVFKKIRAQLRARTQGSRNSGELLVLEAGLKLAAVAPNAAEAAFAELSRLSRDRIFAWFRLSPKLLGIMDEAGGADKIADAQRIFDNKTARPLMNKLQRKITRELVKAWDLAYAIDYEYTMAPEDQVRLVSQFSSIPGVTVDEVRHYMKLGPHPDGTIGELTLNLPGENAGTGQPGDTPTSNGFPDRGLAGEAGRPPKPSNTKVFPKNGGKLPAGAAVRRPAGKALEGARTLDEMMARLDALALGQKALTQEGTTSVGSHLANERRPQDTLASRRVSDVDAIIADMTVELSDAARVLERGLMDNVEGKALNDLVRRIRNSPAWATFTSLMADALKRGYQRALSTAAVHHGSTGLTPSEEIDYEALANSLAHDRKTGAPAMTKTLKERVARAVKESRDGGMAPNDINAAVQSLISDWMTSQAEGIAITEATRGYNEGTLAVAEASGLTHVLVSDGTDHDEPCKEANGKVWSIEEARANPMQHPRCRRAFVPIPQEA